MAGFAAGQPAINLNNDTAIFARDPLQNLNELAIRKVRHLSTPQAFHSIQVKVLNTNDSVLLYQLVCQFEEPVPPTVAYPRVDALQVLQCSASVITALLATGYCTMGLAQVL